MTHSRCSERRGFFWNSGDRKPHQLQEQKTRTMERKNRLQPSMAAQESQGPPRHRTPRRLLLEWQIHGGHLRWWVSNTWYNRYYNFLHNGHVHHSLAYSTFVIYLNSSVLSFSRCSEQLQCSFWRHHCNLNALFSQVWTVGHYENAT